MWNVVAGGIISLPIRCGLWGRAGLCPDPAQGVGGGRTHLPMWCPLLVRWEPSVLSPALRLRPHELTSCPGMGP